MNLIAIPYFMGDPMSGFEVPEPHEMLAPSLPDGDAFDKMGVLYKSLAERVAVLDSPVTYSGDCISALGVLGGLQQRGVEPTLIWFDAHGDFNTPETSPSGFPGGMPLAMATGRGDQRIVDAIGLTPIADDRVILVDARSLDDGEDAAVAESGLRHTSVDDLMSWVPSEGPIHVHLDGDVVDPSEMPAMNYPASNGPSLETVRSTIAELAATGRVVAFSVSSWNPALPGADVAAEATRSLAAPFL